MKLYVPLLSFLLWAQGAHAFPNICTVVKTPSFRSVLGLTHSVSMCGWPVPRPCVHFSYNVPQFFIEVVSNPKESFFSGVPGAAIQLATTSESVPFGAEGDDGSYSFHAHTINVPFTMIGFQGMPCQGYQFDNLCFSSMSEHLGRLWKTGEGDSLQPSWLAWSLSPKACLLKGAAESTVGNSTPTGYPNASLCSFDRSWMTRFPPSNQPVCTGWGIHFPRYGTVTNSDQNTASLIVADRMRSLGSEVFQAVPTSHSDTWQMIYPTASSGFKRGQNVGYLRLKRVSDVGRLWSGKFKNYLYVVWKRVGCTRDVPFIASTQIWLAGLEAACRGL